MSFNQFRHGYSLQYFGVRTPHKGRSSREVVVGVVVVAVVVVVVVRASRLRERAVEGGHSW